MTLTARVTGILDAAQVAHAVIGAAALAAAGVVRSSLDLDLLTLDSRVLDRRFWAGLSEGGAAVDVRRGDMDDPLACTPGARRTCGTSASYWRCQPARP